MPLLACCSKVDLPGAAPIDVALDVAALGLVDDPEAVLFVSAKTGAGVPRVLPAVVEAFASREDADDARSCLLYTSDAADE